MAGIAEAQWLWLQHKLGQGAQLCRMMLKHKASQLAAEQGKKFHPLDGRLSRRKVCGSV
ncbi:hypothetical protein KIL84_012851, partial [Mauremys mutica]